MVVHTAVYVEGQWKPRLLHELLSATAARRCRARPHSRIATFSIQVFFPPTARVLWVINMSAPAHGARMLITHLDGAQSET